MARPIGIDLFSGVGGLSLGFEQAGFDVVAAVEIDPVHAAAHKFNFPHCAVLPRSISSLTGADIRKAAGIGRRPVDIVFGGAPCQGFSMIGQRALDDPRNGLVKDFVRIVFELKASYFVFENVKGLTVGRHKQFLIELVETFRASDYQVDWRVLNSAHFGVPQNRERVIIVGAKKGRKLPRLPDPETRPAGEPRKLADLPAGPSVSDALDDLPDAERFPELLSRDSAGVKRWGRESPYARELRCLANDSWHYGYMRDWDPRVLTSSMRTDHSPISRRRFANTEPGNVEPVSRFFRLPPDGVSNTLRAGTDSARGAFTSPRPIHHELARCVTVREMARLHGFPDWFRFHETKWNGARQIGNSVPPPLGRAVARAVIQAIGEKPTKPKRVIKLGDESLLRLSMKEAALYWGVPVAIGRRDRKSGARKRKQEEIEAILLAAE